MTLHKRTGSERTAVITALDHQDYKDAARAIVNQLLDDVTAQDSADAGYCGRRDDVAQEDGFSDGVVPIQGENCLAEVSFSSAPRTGDSDDEDVEDFASAEEEDDVVEATQAHPSMVLEKKPVTSGTVKLVQELLYSEVVGQVHTPVPATKARPCSPDRQDPTILGFPTAKLDDSRIGGFRTPQLARTDRRSSEVTPVPTPHGVGTPVNTEPCPSTPGPFQSSSGTTSGLTNQLKRVRVASGELETPSPLPSTSLTSTALTPFDLPKLVMDMPPIPAIKLPASPPPNSADIKRHLFDSPLLSAQLENPPEQFEAKEKIVGNKPGSSEHFLASSSTGRDEDLEAGKLTSPSRADNAFEQPLRTGGGYNLDFLDEAGADAADLCPTSPLVRKAGESRCLLYSEDLEFEPAAGVTMKSVAQVEVGNRLELQQKVDVNENSCKDQELPPAPTEDKPISPGNKFNEVRITSSSPGTDEHLVGNDSTDVELPLRSRGGYNLDFLEEVGAEAVNLCPTSPLVVKERRGSVEVVQQNPEEASRWEESSSEDVHLRRSPEASNKEFTVEVSPPSSIDQPLSSKGYDIDFLTAESLNAEDLDPNLVGKKGGLQNSPPTGVTLAKGRKLVKPWMRKKAQKTPLPVRKKEEVLEPEVKELSPSKPSKMEETLVPRVSLGHNLHPISVDEEVVQQEKNFLQADERSQRCYVQDPNEDLEAQPGEEVELPKKPRLMKKSKSTVSFKEVTEEIPQYLSEFAAGVEQKESVLDSTITLEEPRIGNLLPDLDLPVISLFEEAQLLEKDKALAVLVREVEERQEEEELLHEELNRSAESNKAMMHCVNEYEKTIEQLLDEKTKQRSVLTSQAEDRRAELGQVKIEIEDVKRATRDLNKKYSRTREAISGYMTAEAELKGEVETLAGRVKKGGERFEMLKADAEAQLEGANNRLGEVKRSKASELAKLSILLRKAQMHVASLEKEREQKETENAELSKICDDLISKLG